MLGVAFDQDVWIANDEVAALLLPISSLRMPDEILQELIDKNNSELRPEEIRQCGEAKLSEVATNIYQYWLERRSPVADRNRIQERPTKVGRNAPCPCGSGEKYKKCCVQ